MATNRSGSRSDSRRVRFTIGEFGVRPPWETFSNVPASFDALGDNFTVSAAGADLWQGTNDYGVVYLPGGAPENFVATVKVASFDATHSNAKAGIMVRNDVTASATSPGYLVVSEKGNGETEYMHDAGGNGQVNNTDEPVATACPDEQRADVAEGARSSAPSSSVFCSQERHRLDAGRRRHERSRRRPPTQDIGLFVTSHIAGTQATAEFTDWAIDTDPEMPPEEPEYDDPPGCAGAMSDEFDGPLDAGRWTVVRGATGATPATSNGQLCCPVTNGDINEASAGPISYVGQPVPSGDWPGHDEGRPRPRQRVAARGARAGRGRQQLRQVRAHAEPGGCPLLRVPDARPTARARGIGTTSPCPPPSRRRSTCGSTQTGSTLSAAYSTDGTTWTTLTGTGALKAGRHARRVRRR